MLGLLLAVATSLAPADTLLRTRSTLSVPETVIRLRAAAESRGLTVFTVVDHGRNAREAGLELPPTVLVLLGNPAAGTLLMHCDRRAAVDLPLRVLVWQDDEGRTWVGHHSASRLTHDFFLADCGEILERIAGVLEALRREAAGAGGE